MLLVSLLCARVLGVGEREGRQPRKGKKGVEEAAAAAVLSSRIPYCRW